MKTSKTSNTPKMQITVLFDNRKTLMSYMIELGDSVLDVMIENGDECSVTKIINSLRKIGKYTSPEVKVLSVILEWFGFDIEKTRKGSLVTL